MEGKNFPEVEAKLAEESLVSSSPPEIVLAGFEVPEDLRGKTILDIGAGGSTAVLELQKQGARAIAVDFQYSSIPKLMRSVSTYVANTLIHSKRLVDATNVGAETAGDETLKVDTKDIIESATSGLLTMVEFRAGLRDHKLRAVAALAGYLPFKDNSVDMCYSNLGIIPALQGDKDVLIGSVSEVLRVLKPGGNFQIIPWSEPDLEDTARENQEELLKFLKDSNIPYSIDDIDLPSSRLKIVKPKERQSISSVFNKMKSLLKFPRNPKM